MRESSGTPGPEHQHEHTIDSGGHELLSRHSSSQDQPSDLRALHRRYLRLIFPEWGEQRIIEEVEAVFQEQQVEIDEESSRSFRRSVEQNIEGRLAIDAASEQDRRGE